MKNVFSILKEIESTSSRNDKEAILIANTHNELLKKTLLYTFDPYKIYGIGAKSIQKVNTIGTIYHDDFFTLLDWLEINNGGSDVAKLEVNKFISSQDEEDAEWYKRIVLKDLRIGATDGTTNKAFPNLIPTFDIMLAKKFEEHEHKIKDDFIITTKLDGVRNVALRDNGSIKLMSRQGKSFEEFNELIEEIKLLPDNYAYDGEFLVSNPKGLNSKDLYRETMKEVSKKGVKTNVEFHIFDMIPIQEFKDGKSKDKCIERKIILHNTLSQHNFKFIKEVPVLYQGTDKTKVFELLKVETDKGLEGVMVNLNKEYVTKRSDSILKVKTMQDCDLIIVGIEVGSGKYSNTLGRINVSYKENIIGVGSGFSDDMRNEIFNNPDFYIGKIAKIQYFEETTNSKDDKLSLRFPVFMEIRFDKNKESYN